MRVKDIIFCDDIRYEQNNKISLMGVYNDRIVFKVPSDAKISGPISTRLATLVRIEIESGDERPDQFTYELILNGKQLASTRGDFKVTKDQTLANIVILGEGVPLEIGKLGLKVALLSAEKQIFSAEILDALIVQIEAG